MAFSDNWVRGLGKPGVFDLSRGERTLGKGVGPGGARADRLATGVQRVGEGTPEGRQWGCYMARDSGKVEREKPKKLKMG